MNLCFFLLFSFLDVNDLPIFIGSSSGAKSKVPEGTSRNLLLFGTTNDVFRCKPDLSVKLSGGNPMLPFNFLVSSSFFNFT